MSNLSSLTSAQLQRAAGIQEQIEALRLQLSAILNGGDSAPAAELIPEASPEVVPFKTRKKYRLSAEGRAKKIAAQKARWAKVKGITSTAAEAKAEPVVKRRKMSAAGRAKIAAGARARWARFHAEKAGK
jgi:hypothetical protein